MCVTKIFLPSLLFCVVCAKDDPRLVGEGSNTTVVVGREATLSCTVENLHNHKVAWLRVDTQTILTIGAHVITKNHRVAIARGDGRTWTLSIKDVRPADGGRYMCQINTEPMITQTHDLLVFVPPDIVDFNSSSEVLTREGDNVTLHCAASGTPPPSLAWRREDSQQMTVSGHRTSKWSGEWLNLTAVGRKMSGAFLCIATNGVPPSVSKRIILHVLCKPSASMTQKMLGGYIGESVVLQCSIEANPTPVVYWTYLEGSKLPNNDSKYQATMSSEGYKHKASLRISNLSRDDVGTYRCHAENSLGSASDDITFYTLVTTTTSTTTQSTTTMEITTLSTVTLASSTEEVQIEEKIDKTENELQDNYVIVLSQHQMQNLDFPPTT